MKMNILRIFLAAALTISIVSCSDVDVTGPAAETPRPDVPDDGIYTFGISAGQEAGADTDTDTDTRAYLELGSASPDKLTYYWTSGDKVGLTVAGEGSTSSVKVQNVPLTKEGTAKETEGVFSTRITKAQLEALSDGPYDYYSYYPYNASLGGTFPQIEFSVPSTYTIGSNLKLNEFNPAYAPMVAKATAPSLVHLDGETLVHDENRLHLEYKHIMSYAAIEMDVNLLPAGVTVKTITIASNNGVKLWGTYNYNMSTGAGSYSGTGGGTSITISIPAGLNVGNGDVIYVPMPPVDVTGFTFTFNTGSDTQAYETLNTSTDPKFTGLSRGVNFARGKIHPIKVAPSSRYTYSGNTQGVKFQITRSGYYYIEAWGGNGGNKELVSGVVDATGGTSNRIAGLYKFEKDQWITLYIGSAGTNSNISVTGNAAGGTNGSENISGGPYGKGGNGGRYATGVTNSERGSGGGAATFVFCSGTETFSFPDDIVIVSGGGGGSGGKADGLWGTNNASNGGNGGSMTNLLGGNGSNGGTTSMCGKGGTGNGTAGAGGTGSNSNGANGTAGTNGSTVNGNGGNGANGATAGSWDWYFAAGGGGGGGGGGWTTGGGGAGSGGTRAGLGTAPGAGGGGGGGQSFIKTTALNPSDYGITVPTHGRVDPGNNIPINGYVYITFFR